LALISARKRFLLTKQDRIIIKVFLSEYVSFCITPHSCYFTFTDMHLYFVNLVLANNDVEQFTSGLK